MDNKRAELNNTLGSYATNALCFRSLLPIETFQQKYQKIKIYLDSNYPEKSDKDGIKSILKTLNPFNINYFFSWEKAKDMNHNKRFDLFAVSSLLANITPENKDYVLEFLDKKDFNNKEYRINDSFGISSIFNNLSSSTYEIIKSVLYYENETKTDYRFNLSEFGKKDCAFISKIKANNINLLKTMLEAKSSYGFYVFNSRYKIEDLLKNATDNDIPVLQDLISKKYTENDISLYFKLRKINCLEYFETFMNLKNNNKSPINFSEDNISDTAFRIDLDFVATKQEIQKFLDLLYSGRVSPDDFSTIFVRYKPENAALFDLLINAKNENNTYYRFTTAEAFDIIDDLKQKHFDDINFILSKKSLDGKKFIYDNDEVMEATKLIKMGLPLKTLMETPEIGSLSDKDKLKIIGFIRTAKKRVYKDISSIKRFFTSNSLDFSNLDKLKEKLIKSLQIFKNNSKNLYTNSEANVKRFFEAINNINTLTNFDFKQYASSGLPLEYKQEDFIRESTNVLSSLNPLEKGIVCEFFNLTPNSTTLSGLPVPTDISDKNITEFVSDKLSNNPGLNVEIVRDNIKKLYPIVKKFTENNKILINGEAGEILNSIIKACPEFISTVGRKQHPPHVYTLDVHTLITLQNFLNQLNSPENIGTISSEDKLVGTMAVLLHDLTKKEGEIDESHSAESELEAYSILKRLNLPNNIAERICGLIKNHHWTEILDKNGITKEQIALNFRKPGDFKLATMFAYADIDGVGDKELAREWKASFTPAIPEIQSIINKIHSNGIFIPQTRIPKASDLAKDLNNIIRINKNTDLESLGFEKGTTYDNFTAIVHCVHSTDTELLRDINYVSKEGNEGILSCSVVDAKQCNLFWENGIAIVLDVDNSNIGAFYKENINSGREKMFNKFQSYLLDDNTENYNYRKFLGNKIRAKLPEYDYTKLFQELSKCKTLEDIKDNKVKKAIKSIFFEDILLSKGINELIAYAPKPVALMTKLEPQHIPNDFINFAKENNLPILIMEADEIPETSSI